MNTICLFANALQCRCRYLFPFPLIVTTQIAMKGRCKINFLDRRTLHNISAFLPQTVSIMYGVIT